MRKLTVILLCLCVWGCGNSKKDAAPTAAPQTKKAVVPVDPQPVSEKPSAPVDPFVLLDAADRRGPRDLVLVAVGDVAQPTTQWVEATENLKEKVFDPTRAMSESADLAFMNLENPVTTARPKSRKTYAFTSHPNRLDWYFGAGYNLYSLANNHTADAGQAGIEATIENLEKYAKKHDKRVYYAGSGKTPEEAISPLIFKPEGKDLTIAFFSLGFSKSDNVAKFYDETLEQRIKDADKQADIVIVSSHAGKEYIHVPEPDMLQRYRSWVDWGADLVLGHHTHCIRPVEAYKGALIYYSMGNFVFMSRTIRHRKMKAKLYGMLTRIVIQDGRVAGAEIVPTWVNNSEDWTLPTGEVMPNAQFVPQVLEGPFAAKYFEDLNRWASKVEIAPLELHDDVARIRLQPGAQ